jgi:hypothetical protein
MIARSRSPTTWSVLMEDRSARLRRRDLRRLTLDHLVPLAANGSRRVQKYDVAGYQLIEEPTDRRQVLLLRRRASRQLVHILSDHPRHDARELDAAPIAPSQQPPHCMAVGLASVGVSNRAAEELLPDEDGRGTCIGDDRRRSAVRPNDQVPCRRRNRHQLRSSFPFLSPSALHPAPVSSIIGGLGTATILSVAFRIRLGDWGPLSSPPRAAAPRPAWGAVRTAACTPG